MKIRRAEKTTYIYWLFDARPRIIARFGQPQPFYCGKTDRNVQRRLCEHISNAKREPKRTPAYRQIVKCVEHLSIEVVEIVPIGDDWAERETFWINQLRKINRNCKNAAAGGVGAPGFRWSDEQRAALSIVRKGHRHSPETRAKISSSLMRTPQIPTRLKFLASQYPGGARAHKKRFSYLYG